MGSGVPGNGTVRQSANAQPARGIARTSRCSPVARSLPTLHCRVDGIWGEFDQLYAGTMDQLEGVLRRMPNFGELVRVPDAGHWVAYENAARFNEALLRLLAEA